MLFKNFKKHVLYKWRPIKMFNVNFGEYKAVHKNGSDSNKQVFMEYISQLGCH